MELTKESFKPTAWRAWSKERATQPDPRNRSLTRQLIVSLILAILFVSAVAVTTVYLVLSVSAKRAANQKADELLAYLVGSLELPLWNMDDNAVKMVGRTVSLDQSIARLVVKNDSGTILFSTEKNPRGPMFSRVGQIVHWRRDQPKWIGEVRVAFTAAGYRESNRQLVYTASLIILLILVAVAIVTVVFIRSALRKPIENLNAITQKYASGQYDLSDHAIHYLEFQPFGHALSELARTIQEQIGSVQKAEKEVRKLNVELEQRVAERTAELSVAKARAESANLAKTKFLSSMSHELRTPLNAVLGFAHLMKTSPDATPEQVANLEIIAQSGEHLLALINNVLDISKIESGRVLLEETTTDLHQLLQDVLSLMFVKASEKELCFCLEQSPDFPRFALLDPGKLRQILLNLVANAIKFTSAGRIVLKAMLASGSVPLSETAPRETQSLSDGLTEATDHSPSQPNRLRFEVQDSGPGIPPADAERIFQPYEQRPGHPASEPGTGLGLAISKQYVELMGGTIGLSSALGHGSLFYFEIPLKAPVPSELPGHEPRRGRVIGLEADQQRRYRLLIVEDQPENRQLLRNILAPLGFELREAENGQQAVQLCKVWSPDLVWMDIRMPVMGGLEATRLIKQTEQRAKAKIIALTAHALEEERREILRSGCDDLIRKPYRSEEIFDALAKHLGVRFKYAPTKAPPRGKSPEEIPPDRLASLPLELLDNLLNAAERLDRERLLEVIKHIQSTDPTLGELLRGTVESLAYKELLQALDALKERRAP